ncbi:MAG: hypothetical protein WDN76_02430 [Alphaproteobacteria bacterium]
MDKPVLQLAVKPVFLMSCASGKPSPSKLGFGQSDEIDVVVLLANAAIEKRSAPPS